MDVNLGTPITLALVALALIPFVRQLVGKGGSSCDGCSGSCDGCSGCGAVDKMVRDMERDANRAGTVAKQG